MTDRMRITILPGGLVKVETDQVTGPNHLSADRLIRGLEQDLGGDPQVERKKQGVLHEHETHRERESVSLPENPITERKIYGNHESNTIRPS